MSLRGEVVSVSRGYMRNFLQPRKLAEQATEAKVAELAKREAERARHEARTADQAEAIAETLRKTVLRFEVNAGSAARCSAPSRRPTSPTSSGERGRSAIDRRKIDLSDPIKRIGRCEIPISVFEGVVVEVKTLVVPIGGELPPEEELEAYAAEEAAKPRRLPRPTARRRPRRAAIEEGRRGTRRQKKPPRPRPRGRGCGRRARRGRGRTRAGGVRRAGGACRPSPRPTQRPSPRTRKAARGWAPAGLAGRASISS